MNPQVNTTPAAVEPTPQVDPQPVQTTVEENTQLDATQKSSEMQPEASGTSIDNQTDVTNPNESKTIDYEAENAELKKQLEILQQNQQAQIDLAERLGTNKVDDIQLLQANNQMDILDNQAQQAYVNICNKFGVDYRSDKIQESAKALKERDPQAFYDLQYQLEQLDGEVGARRQELNNFILNRQYETAISKHQALLNASPVLQQTLNQYIQDSGLIEPQTQVDKFMEYAMAIQREAFEYGKIFAQQEAMKQPTSPANVLNNSVATQTTTFNQEPPRTFTRAEIANMSQSDFEKYEKEIDRAQREGRIV